MTGWMGDLEGFQSAATVLINNKDENSISERSN